MAPILARHGGGTLLNVLSLLSWVNTPTLGAYGVSKSAAWGSEVFVDDVSRQVHQALSSSVYLTDVMAG